MMTTVNMQAATTTSDHYKFVPAEKDGLHCLLLVTDEMLAAPPPFTPLFMWVSEQPDQRDAAARWLEERRDRWQQWGELARRGADLLHEELTATLQAEPLPPISWGFSVGADADGTRITLFEHFDAHGHPEKVAVWSATYATAGEYRRVLRWLVRTDVMPAWQALARLARVEGPDAVTQVIAENVGKARGKKRRRG